MTYINCYYYSFYMSNELLNKFTFNRNNLIDTYSKNLIYLEPLKKNSLKSHKSLYKDMDSLEDIYQDLVFDEEILFDKSISTRVINTTKKIVSNGSRQLCDFQ